MKICGNLQLIQHGEQLLQERTGINEKLQLNRNVGHLRQEENATDNGQIDPITQEILEAAMGSSKL